ILFLLVSIFEFAFAPLNLISFAVMAMITPMWLLPITAAALTLLRLYIRLTQDLISLELNLSQSMISEK
uniref:hypothetical protein n=1 Tax=uncultured Bartonella sp. TaxID=104108 RepID=UPI0025E12132